MNLKGRIRFSRSTKYRMKKIKRCENCGSKDKNLSTHHIRPLSRGGTNNRSNLARVCDDCHKELDYEALNFGSYHLHN